MTTPVQITWRGIAYSAALEQRIAAEVRKLERVCDRIIRCNVIVEKQLSSMQKQFVVRINLVLPGTEMAVNRDDDEEIDLAIQNACEAVNRQLIEYMSRLASAEQRSQRR